MAETGAVESVEDREVTWLELFYDLVYVVLVAVLATQLSHDLTLNGFVVFAALFVPVWWSWVAHTNFTSRLGKDDGLQRGVTMFNMFAAGAMAIQLPNALGVGAPGFAMSYVAIRMSMFVLYGRAFRDHPEAQGLGRFNLFGFSTSVGLWTLSIFVPAPARYAFWAAGLAIEIIGFMISGTVFRRFPAHTRHLPHRFGLFTIIVLGETILAVLVGIADVSWSLASVATAACGFAISGAIWWNYFGFVERAPLQCTLGTGQAYTVLHFPLMLGLIAAGVGLEHLIVESSEASFHAETAWLFVGGLIVFLASFLAIQALTLPKEERARIGAVYGSTAAGVVPLAFFGPDYLPPGLVAAVLAVAFTGLAWHEQRRWVDVPRKAFYSPGPRGRPQTRQRPKDYEGREITVRFDPRVCVHSGVCLRTLPEVFDTRHRPWVEPDVATRDAVMAAVAKCPSGALTYRLPSGKVGPRRPKETDSA